MKESINKWMLAALATWTVLVLVIAALVITVGDRVWFNIASHSDVSALMQDKQDYIEGYSFKASPKE